MAMASAPGSDLLDLPPWIGQQAVSFRFDVVDRVTGRRKGQLTPHRDSAPSLEHDTGSTISRRISSLVLGSADAALVDPLADRINVWMVAGDPPLGVWPLGRYIVADAIELESTGGVTSPITLYDEMLIVDQELDSAFDAGGQLVDQAVLRLLSGLPIGEPLIDGTEHTAVNSWSAGASRASALEELATLGGYFKPWFDHRGRLRVRRAFEPAEQTPTIDLDATRRVFRDSITRQSGLLDAPNRFVVVSNDVSEDALPVVGVYDVPLSAPHSIARRGFVLPRTFDVQVSSRSQAQVYARTLGIQHTVYETVELSTPPDPRHDGYDVVRWDGVLWLEVAWSMSLTAGAEMRHTLRRAYPTFGGD